MIPLRTPITITRRADRTISINMPAYAARLLYLLLSEGWSETAALTVGKDLKDALDLQMRKG